MNTHKFSGPGSDRGSAQTDTSANASIVVCTFNRSVSLRRTVDSLLGQSVWTNAGLSGRFEVVVLDDGSSDDTPLLCQDWSRRHPHIRYARHAGNRGLACSRNTAAREAKGSCLLFLDDDCVAEAGWAEELYLALGQHELVAGAVSTPASPLLLMSHNLSQFHPFFPELKPGAIDFLAGANFAVRRSLLESLGCFDESLKCAEDFDFVLRARERGIRPWFEPRAAVTHLPDRSTPGSILAYAMEHASHTIRLRQRHASVLKTPGLLRHPLLILLLSPLIALAVTAKIFKNNPGRLRYLRAFPWVFLTKLAWCLGAARGLSRWRRSQA